MANPIAAGELRVASRAGGGMRRVLIGSGLRIVVTGCRGAEWPESLHDARLEPTVEPGGWVLVCSGGRFAFSARSVEVHEGRPQLFDPLLAGFSLSARERLAVRLLLRLLRLPGGARLLRAWHAMRG